MVQQFLKLAGGLLAPRPRIFERFNLRLALFSLGRFEQEIVVALGVERRVEIDEVNSLVLNVLTQHLKVVAEVKLVHAMRRLGKQSRAVNAALTGINPDLSAPLYQSSQVCRTKLLWAIAWNQFDAPALTRRNSTAAPFLVHTPSSDGVSRRGSHHQAGFL